MYSRNGSVRPGILGKVNSSKMPIRLVWPVAASTIVRSQIKIALHLGSGMPAMLVPYFKFRSWRVPSQGRRARRGRPVRVHESSPGSQAGVRERGELFPRRPFLARKLHSVVLQLSSRGLWHHGGYAVVPEHRSHVFRDRNLRSDGRRFSPAGPLDPPLLSVAACGPVPQGPCAGRPFQGRSGSVSKSHSLPAGSQAPAWEPVSRAGSLRRPEAGDSSDGRSQAGAWERGRGFGRGVLRLAGVEHFEEPGLHGRAQAFGEPGRDFAIAELRLRM